MADEGGSTGAGAGAGTDTGAQSNAGTSGAGDDKTTQAGSGTVTTPNGNDWIPQEYQSKEWVQNILKTSDPRTELFKQYENQASLIGRQSIQKPGDGATPEQINQWRKHIGVPDDTTGYEVKPLEWGAEDKPFAEYLTASRPAEFIDGLKAEAHKLGMTPDQFNGALNAYDKLFVQHHKEFLTAEVAKEAKLNRDFSEVALEAFGDKKDQVINRAAELIKATVPENIKPFIAQLDSKALLILSSAMNGVYEKYAKEDSNFSNASSAATGQTALDQARELKKDPRYRDVMHPEYKQIKQQVDDLYKAAAGVK